MSDLLSSSFVEHHIASLPGNLIPESWGIERHIAHYQLDLKMCQLKNLDYGFHWGDERDPAPRISSILETPSKIVRLDVSLNELTSIPHDGLLPFRNLRALDASLNQIRHFQGVEVLHHLYSLNLSHNNIKRVDGLLNSRSLGELNLSNNNISDISGIPSLINLRVLNVSNNKLENLEGASSFPKLEEVYANHNELHELLPLTSCLHLRVVSASHNRIKSLDGVLRLIVRLKDLQVVNLSGNPVERERTYQSDILRAGNIMTLDNIAVNPMPPAKEDHKRHADNLYTLRDAAKQAFEDRMRIAKDRMDENVNFLQRRILSVQREYREFEQKLKADLDACLRYLDTLSEVELSNAGRSNIGAPYDTAMPAPYPFQDNGEPLSSQRHLPPHRSKDEPKDDYSKVRETDELLRCAFKELIKQRDKNLDI